MVRGAPANAHRGTWRVGSRSRGPRVEVHDPARGELEGPGSPRHGAIPRPCPRVFARRERLLDRVALPLGGCRIRNPRGKGPRRHPDHADRKPRSSGPAGEQGRRDPPCRGKQGQPLCDETLSRVVGLHPRDRRRLDGRGAVRFAPSECVFHPGWHRGVLGPAQRGGRGTNPRSARVPSCDHPLIVHGKTIEGSTGVCSRRTRGAADCQDSPLRLTPENRNEVSLYRGIGRCGPDGFRPAGPAPVSRLAAFPVPRVARARRGAIVRETSPANRAGRLAGVTATFMTVAVVAPVLGGYLADTVGFPFLFSLGGLILAVNLIRARRLVRREESFSYVIDLRRMGSRTALAFAGQGGVDGLLSVATPLGSFLLTRDSFALGLLFALFSLAAGIAAVVLGRVSDPVKVRRPFLLLGPVLSVPACLLAFVSRDLGSFAFAIGWLSMTAVVAPSFIYTILVARMEDSIPAVTATREFILNTSRSVALFAGLIVLAFGGDVYALYLLVGGVILLEALAK